jgi:hypothetical protein
MLSPGPPVDADGGLGAAGRGTGAGGAGGRDGSAGGPAGASAASAGDPAGASPVGAEGCSRTRGVGGSGSPNSGAGCSGAGRRSVAGCSLASWGPGFGLAISLLADRSSRTGSRATGSGGGGSLLVGSGGAIGGGGKLSRLGTGISVFAESSARIGHAGPAGSSPAGIGGSPKTGTRVGTSRAVNWGRSGTTGCGGGVKTLFGAEGTALFAAGDEPGGREAVTAWRRGAGGAFACLVSVMATVSRRAAAPLSPAVSRGLGLAAGGTIGRRPGSGRGPTAVGGGSAAGPERSAAAGVAPAADPSMLDSQAAGPDMVRSTQATSGWPLAAPDSGVATRSRSIATAP